MRTEYRSHVIPPNNIPLGVFSDGCIIAKELSHTNDAYYWRLSDSFEEYGYAEFGVIYSGGTIYSFTGRGVNGTAGGMAFVVHIISESGQVYFFTQLPLNSPDFTQPYNLKIDESTGVFYLNYTTAISLQQYNITYTVGVGFGSESAGWAGDIEISNGIYIGDKYFEAYVNRNITAIAQDILSVQHGIRTRKR